MLTAVLSWLKAAKLDVACLQKLNDQDSFPIIAIEKAGYRAAWVRQRSWNGVAILICPVGPAGQVSYHELQWPIAHETRV